MKIMHAMIATVAICAAPMSMAQGQSSEAEADAANLAVVEAHIAAYRSGNLDRFVATFAPNAEVYANGMEARGHKEIRALYALNFTKGAPKVRIEETEAANGMVYVTVGYVFSDGQEMCCSLSEYEVVNGKIVYLSASG